MGSVNLHSLLTLPEEEARYELEEVRAIEICRQLSAMLTGYADTAREDQLVYLEEVPISTFLVPCTIKDSDSNSHRWLRLEVLFEGRDKTIKSGHQLVIAEHPYHIKRVHYAAFMRGAKHGRPEPDRAFKSLDEAIRWAHSFSHDYFYTGKGLISAVSQPHEILDDDSSRIPKNALFVFGICENITQYEETLYQSEVVQKLLRQTEQRTIRFAPPEHYSSLPKLPEELVSEANNLMFMAIRQSLGGPHEDSEEWLKRPVTDKINQLYRGHLFNEWRRYQNIIKAED